MLGETPGDEQELIDKAAAGSAEAFEDLVRRHQDRLYGLIHRLVGDPEQALDLTQETFLKAWKGLARFEGACAFYTWLYRIARNVIISRARYESARPRLTASLSDCDDGGGRSFAEPEARAKTPEQEAISGERRAALLQAVHALPEDFREVIVLRDMQDHSYEEIALLLEIPLGTVRSRLHRARLELRERLTPIIGPTLSG